MPGPSAEITHTTHCDGARALVTAIPERGASSLPEYIWQTRYRDPDAHPPERSIQDTWRRVALAVAAVERDPGEWVERFVALLSDFRFLPGGRIIAGAGTDRPVTLFSCFVMGALDDSVDRIFAALREGALTMQFGGGVGYDFSTLRPRGSKVRTTGLVAAGPVSYMRVWDAMCATIRSSGARRGAMMATLRCDHPDIEEFIDAKREVGLLPHFNLSVLISDAFMEAIRADAPWPLVFPAAALGEDDHDDCIERAWSGSREPQRCRIAKVVPAKRLWSRLCASAYETAEPGVLFIDRINATNNLGYRETLSATNPCAEEPLPHYGACNLGSINLTRFIDDPFTSAARVDEAAMCTAVQLAVRFLDNVIDVSNFPLSRQREEVIRARRIGLGVTGLADALAMLRLRYDTAEARNAAARILRTIRDAAYGASIDLAVTRGPFPAFDAVRFLESPFVRALPPRVRDGIRRHGIRNSHLLALAPAGTISLLAGNVSSGIEPIFATEATRRVAGAQGGECRFPVVDFAYARWRAGNPDHTIDPPSWFVTADSIAPNDHLLMQAALQPFVDGAISKTIALGRHIEHSAAATILEAAYGLGLKGCTLHRPKARPGILRRREPDLAESAPAECQPCNPDGAICASTGEGSIQGKQAVLPAEAPPSRPAGATAPGSP